MEERDIKIIQELLKEDRNFLISALPDSIKHETAPETKRMINEVKGEITCIKDTQKEHNIKHEEGMEEIRKGLEDIKIKQISTYSKKEIDEKFDRLEGKFAPKSTQEGVQRWTSWVIGGVGMIILTAIMNLILNQ